MDGKPGAYFHTIVCMFDWIPSIKKEKWVSCVDLHSYPTLELFSGYPPTWRQKVRLQWLQPYLLQLGISWPAKGQPKKFLRYFSPPPSLQFQLGMAKGTAGKLFRAKAKKVWLVYGSLVPGVVLIPLRIATKLSMTKSECILEN